MCRAAGISRQQEQRGEQAKASHKLLVSGCIWYQWFVNVHEQVELGRHEQVHDHKQVGAVGRRTCGREQGALVGRKQVVVGGGRRA